MTHNDKVRAIYQVLATHRRVAERLSECLPESKYQERNRISPESVGSWIRNERETVFPATMEAIDKLYKEVTE